MTVDAETTPVTTPVPGPPRVARPPVAAVGDGPAGDTRPWGRVDDAGVVSVREGDLWRVVGEYPDGTPDEALAYFRRKYDDLVGEVALLEARLRAGGASASDLASTASALRERVTGAPAVGDLAALQARLDTLLQSLQAATTAQTAAAHEAVDAAIAARTAVVLRVEELAARDPKTVQWKQTTVELNELFAQWQTQQQSGPRLPKSAANRLWKRFRDARSVIDRQRREFYAELDEAHKSARARKTALVERAEALGPRGEDGIGAYRDLLDAWKAAGHAGRKTDDALWARFKAAGDVLYGARTSREEAEIAESAEKIEAKQRLLAEAAPLVDAKDLVAARAALTSVQRRWDDIGRVFPRERERALDGDMRRIEQAVRAREDADWKRNEPEKKARTTDMTRQLEDAIAKLEQELAGAQAAGDADAAARVSEALQARRAWLRAVGG